MAAHRGGAAGFPAPVASVANTERTTESPGANRGTSGVRSVPVGRLFDIVDF